MIFSIYFVLESLLPGGESWQPLGQTTPPAYEQVPFVRARDGRMARLVSTCFKCERHDGMCTCIDIYIYAYYEYMIYIYICIYIYKYTGYMYTSHI